MKYSIQFEENVLKDFNNQKKYYNNISQKLSLRFSIDFWEKIDYIKNHPLQHLLRY